MLWALQLDADHKELSPHCRFSYRAEIKHTPLFSAQISTQTFRPYSQTSQRNKSAAPPTENEFNVSSKCHTKRLLRTHCKSTKFYTKGSHPYLVILQGRNGTGLVPALCLIGVLCRINIRGGEMETNEYVFQFNTSVTLSEIY